MDRRQFLLRSSLIAAGVTLPFKEILAGRPGNFTELRRNVGYFTERGGTIGYLVTSDAMVVVDTQFPETAKNCLNGLQDRSDHPLDLVINTHHHGDHTAGNPVFKGVAEKMVAHENVPKLMKQSAEEEEQGEVNPAYPTTTFSDNWEMDAGDETLHAKYYGRGHTSGDSVIYFENANVVHMGDLIFNRMNPYTDRPAGASIMNWIEILQTVKNEYPSDAMYIFGHGKPEFGVTGSGKDLLVMRDYLQAMTEHVKQGIEANKSKEEIIDKKQMENFPQFMYADWWTLSQNLEVVYNELTE